MASNADSGINVSAGTSSVRAETGIEGTGVPHLEHLVSEALNETPQFGFTQMMSVMGIGPTVNQE